MRPARIVFGYNRLHLSLLAKIEMGKLIVVPSSVLPTAFVETACLFKVSYRSPRIPAAPLVTAFRLRFGRRTDEGDGDDETPRKKVRVHPSLHFLPGEVCYFWFIEALVTYFTTRLF